MGGVAKAIGGGVNSITGPLIGTKLFGGSQGNSYDPQTDNEALNVYDNFARQGNSLLNPDSIGQSAAEGVQNNPLLKSLYGQGGLQSQLATQGQDLASRGFQMQGQDYEALGQAQGDITRQYGQYDDQLAKQLQARGLGGAASGAAVRGYSGLLGNKFEQLAKAQTDIAQKRLENAQGRLQQNYQMQAQLGQQAAGAQEQQAQRSLSARQQQASELSNAASLRQQQITGINDAQRQSMADKAANYRPGLLQAAGQGVTGALTGLPSILAGAAAGKGMAGKATAGAGG